ncbi:MAG: L-erythro-3,5-diaminohexanoate dehydrogenase [Candidatus Eremiobacteraeota bacterium]|nr:L-erythro-3,5-diaminohexanoate dehydrogenase [Candidatus Eremiobacteraeota bacterium]MBV9055780.1 L-erythro-3,5-diaminohexanoate dehydrogenase [Candidatus Eremiobacteraeota bacterium]MBV9699134.1 L-erythro-3,5-diaminohexanoate dehydrogenase [Candidatus Eremiobacteraeota bacterium]
MSALPKVRPHRLGTHRVLEPLGVMPQQAWRVDNTPVAAENEILCDVDVLNVDSASFKQIADACDADAARISEHILRTVRERGKQHNPVTGSGGMFVGRVREIGKDLRDRIALRAGDRIASLVSLSLTPLHVEAVREVDVATGRIWVTAKAILFESGIWARLPEDIDENVALAVLDVAGAPAQVPRLCAPGQTVVVIGAAGKSGLFSCAQAKACVGPSGRVVGVVHDAASAAAQLLTRAGLVDDLLEADATDALATSGKVEAVAPQLADVTINCVNVPGTELCSILCTRDGGTIYFFSMSTSFTAAALGAEGIGRDVTMIIGNGYARNHADIALQTLRDHADLHAYFNAKYTKGSTP